jgi:hypothetical protein
MISNILNLIRAKRSKPIARLREVRFLPYGEADKLIRETNGAWVIAKEEDKNRVLGWVYLERRDS